MPVDVIGLPMLALDERTETSWWDTANYFRRARWTLAARPTWLFAYARTLPGHPTSTSDVRPG